MGWNLFIGGLGLCAFATAQADCPHPPIEGPLANQSALVSTCLNLSPTLQARAQYGRYLEDTLQGIERMRGENGLLVDVARIVAGKGGEPARLDFDPATAGTSLTNVGLDLLIQTEQAHRPGAVGLRAQRNLARALDTLSKEPYHDASGLFFSWYATQGLQVDQHHPSPHDVSSVDNLHLALALWTIAKNFPERSPIRQQAESLFKRMDLSVFWNPKTNRAYGNLRYSKRNGKESWTPQSWEYEEFGAEARDIYSVGHALGLFKREADDPNFVKNVLKSVHTEFHSTPNGKVLATWDGGVFQVMLPELLIRESAYSSSMAESDSALGQFILASEDPRTHVMRRANSASQFGDHTEAFKHVPDYNGRAGIPELVTCTDPDLAKPKKRENWDKVATMHAEIFGAMAAPDSYASALAQSENMTSNGNRLYNPGIGWSDGVHVKGEYKDQVVPISLSLDQSMIALSLMRILDPEAQGTSAGTLAADPLVRARLEEFYRAVDQLPRTSPCGK